jgi:hypothetical protein
MAISDYSTTAASNVLISGIDISGTTGKVKDGDNAIRQMMADIKAGVPYLSGTSYLIESTDAGAAVGPVFELYRNSATPANSDILGKVLFNGEDSAGNTQEYASIETVIVDVTSTSEDGQLDFYVTKAGTRTKFASMTATATAFTAAAAYSFDAAVTPSANDAAALGASGTAWADLFLASGAVINIAAANWVATHTSGILTVGTGDLRVTTAGTNTASVATVGGTQTLTSKTLTSPVLNTPTVGTSILPTANDGAALGASGTAFSDLFLASGAVINADAGNAVITHSSGIWTVSTGDLRVTTAGTNAASVVTVGGTQTLTNKTLTAPAIGAATGTSVALTTQVDVGTYSGVGASDGKQITTAALFSSRASVAAQNHVIFANPNGTVGTIGTSASSTSYNTSSDERLKKNFSDFDAGAILDAIKVYHYDWRAKGSGDGYGPKAQELYAVFPHAVTVGSKGDKPEDPTFEPWSYDASKMVPLLIKEVQALRARVAALDAK